MKSKRKPQPPHLPNATNARQFAFSLVDRYEQTGDFVSQQLEMHRYRDIAPQERRLAQEIASGVIRRKATLQAILGKCVQRERSKIENRLWRLIEIGCYQLLFTDGVADHAAIKETVDLCRWQNEPRWTGFLNGVLRGVQRLCADGYQSAPACDAVAIRPGEFRKLNEAVFPDPAKSDIEFLSGQFSLPRWLLRRWKTRFTFDEVIDIGFWFLQPGPMSLRINPMNSTRDNYLKTLSDLKIDARPGQHSQCVILEDRQPVALLPGFAEGHFSVQDETAMQVSSLLNPQPHEAVLDLCAAPGTKTAHLAELMNGEGTIAACDIRESRLAKVSDNASRLGVTNIATTLVLEDGRGIPTGPFDAVLVDAPCSNTGVLGKRPEARWRMSVEDIAELTEIQTQLLTDAVSRTRSGGRIVYSTCSIEPDENQAIVDVVCSNHGGLTVEQVLEIMPGQPSDGGFAALLRKA